MINKLIIKIFLITVLALFTLNILFPIIKLHKKGLDPHGTHKGYSILARLSLISAFIWILNICIFIFFEELTSFFWLISLLNSDFSIIVGIIMGIIGLIFILLGTITLGSNFRIELPKEDTELITTGIYRLLRNPIVFGVHLLMIGTFLIIPKLITSIILIFNLITFDAKARDEEKFLLKRFGGKYNNYRNTVGRYTPFSLRKY